MLRNVYERRGSPVRILDNFNPHVNAVDKMPNDLANKVELVEEVLLYLF